MTDKAPQAARGGLALAAAKIYFIGIGLIQQIALKHLLGLGGYGAYSTASSIASITYNPLNQTSILGVSREVAACQEEERAARARQLISLHGTLAAIVSGIFALTARGLATQLGAPHIASSLRILAIVLFCYGFYAPVIGYLNGTRRFFAQASLDIVAATLRTLGLAIGALLGPRLLSSESETLARVEGALLGFALASAVILVLSLVIARIRRDGKSTLPLWPYLRFARRVLISQVLLNLLFQADALLLRKFASDAAIHSGLGVEAADPLVGAYRAAQLFCFLPYQLLMSVTFILFPLLASAWSQNDREKTQELILGGTRIALLVAGLMVAALVGNPKGLIALVYGNDAAQLGYGAMRILSVGLGAFGIMGVLSSALTSLGHERLALRIVAFSSFLVGASCLLFVDRSSLSPSLLWQTALATSCALMLGTWLSAFSLKKVAGASVPLLSLLRALVALALAAGASALCAQALGTGFLSTLTSAALVLPIYLGTLLFSRELRLQELASFFRR